MLKLKSLRAKFVFGVAVYALVVLMVIIAVIYFVIGGMLSRGALSEFSAHTERSANHTDSWLTEKLSMMDTIYRYFPFLPDDETKNSVLVSLTDSGANHYVGFSDGRSLHGSGWIRTPEWHPHERPWWAAAMGDRSRAVFFLSLCGCKNA